MSLLGLPNELLQAIAVYCGVDGEGLARANRRLHDNTNDILWQSGIVDEDSFTKMTARAAQSGNLKTMKKAAAYGADFDLIHPVTWYQDMTKFDSAKHFPYWKEGDELSQFWASPLHLAVYHNHYDTVEWLITVQGVDVDAPGRLICDCRGVADHHGCFVDFPVWTALHWAICRNHDSIARLLLSRNAATSVMLPPSFMTARHVISPRLRDIDTPDLGLTEEMTALHVAALHGTKSMVTHLVQARGMDINERDFNVRESIDFQPIHYAIVSQDDTMIQHLVSLGASPGGTNEGWDEYRDTPLYWATHHENLKGLFKLLDAGAKAWFDEEQERKAILSQGELLSFIDRLGNPEKVMEAMVKLVDKTLQDYASDSTGCLPIESELRSALKIMSQVAPEDWNPSIAFSKTAKRLLRNVFASMMDIGSPYSLGSYFTEFANKVWDWKCGLDREEKEGIVW